MKVAPRIADKLISQNQDNDLSKIFAQTRIPDHAGGISIVILRGDIKLLITILLFFGMAMEIVEIGRPLTEK